MAETPNACHAKSELVHDLHKKNHLHASICDQMRSTHIKTLRFCWPQWQTSAKSRPFTAFTKLSTFRFLSAFYTRHAKLVWRRQGNCARLMNCKTWSVMDGPLSVVESSRPMNSWSTEGTQSKRCHAPILEFDCSTVTCFLTVSTTCQSWIFTRTKLNHYTTITIRIFDKLQ